MRNDHLVKSVYYLYSLESLRFSSIFRCEVEVKDHVLVQANRHSLLVHCDPSTLAQDIGHSLGLGELFLLNRSAEDDLWSPEPVLESDPRIVTHRRTKFPECCLCTLRPGLRCLSP